MRGMYEKSIYDQINEKIKLIFIEKEINESDRLKMIRDKISKWANSIPGHNFKDLGDKIELLKVIEKPAYVITLQTQYEIRKLEKGIRPYKGEKIPPKLIDEEYVDIWAFDTPGVKDFEKKEEAFLIPNSQEVIKCHECKGKGEVYCDSCNGAGVKTCASCGGRGEVKCSSCGGSGEHVCWWCGGSGQKGPFENCPRCGGRGRNPCKECRNGYQNCKYCGGRGQVLCSTCKGRRMLICKKCEGEGEVVMYLYFVNIFEPTIQTEIIYPSELPKEIISGQFIYDIEKRTNKKALKEQEGTPVLEIVQETIPENILEISPYGAVKKTVSRLISFSKEGKEIENIDKNWRIVKQKLIVSQINALKIDYKYLDKSYCLWLYGKEYELLFDSKSPISEIYENYYLTAQNLFKKKEYFQALECIEKAILMNPMKEEFKKLKKTIINKTRLSYVLRGILGGLVSSIILSLLTGPAPVTFLVSGLICGLTGAIVGDIFGIFFLIKRGKSKKRYLRTFCISAILSFFGVFLLLPLILLIYPILAVIFNKKLR
ncbi:MAG: hypothetical protein QW643_05170 [Thermoplasmata archaeon]